MKRTLESLVFLLLVFVILGGGGKSWARPRVGSASAWSIITDMLMIRLRNALTALFFAIRSLSEIGA